MKVIFLQKNEYLIDGLHDRNLRREETAMTEAKRKKIAFYINGLGRGGAERVTVNLARHFVSKGYEVLLVTSRYCEDEYEQPQGTRRIISETIEPGSRNPVSYFYRRFQTIRKIWKTERPDVLVCFIGKCNVIGLLTSWGLGFPVFVSVRSDPRQEYASRLMKMLSKTLFGKARGIIVQTQEAKDYFPRFMQKKTVILPNSLEKRFIKPRFEGIRKNEIVSVGRLDENKNQKLLIDAFAAIAADYPEMVLKIYGDETHDVSTKDALEIQIQRLHLEGRVMLMGRRSDIPEQIYESRIYVLTSNFEGMPNALLEAMSLGLACISTDCPCGGPRTVIRDGENGLLIPVGDEEALEQAFRRILDDGAFEKFLGENAHRLGEQLTPQRVNESWEQFLL